MIRSNSRPEGFQMSRLGLIPCLLLGCLTLLVVGCGPTANTQDTYPVKGKVTYDGAPLPSGLIFFEEPTKGISNAIPIENGEYSGQAAAGDLKARVSKTEKIKNPMSNEESVKETPLKSGISVTIKTGSNSLPQIDIMPGER